MEPQAQQQPQQLQAEHVQASAQGQQNVADMQLVDQSHQQLPADYVQQEQVMQQQEQVWYQLDARGKIENYDEADWFVPEQLPFKRRQHVASSMAASKPHPWKRVRQLVAADNYQDLPADTPTYVNLEAPPPLYPPKRYCDITGCEAPYVDPKTQLRYANAEAFRIARSLTADEVQARLAIRNAQSVLK